MAKSTAKRLAFLTVVALTAAAWGQTTRPENARVRADGWFPARAGQSSRPARPGEVRNAFVIPIHGEINASLLETVERKIVLCRGKGADLVIFDVDTYGGEITAMDRICQAITRDLAQTYTVAFVNPKAISAGAIISLACSEIVVRRGSVIGDALAVRIGPDGRMEHAADEEVRNKLRSYKYAGARALAQLNGYSEDLCAAMEKTHVEVWLIRHRATGRLDTVDPDKNRWRSRVAGAPGTSGGAGAEETLEWEYLRRIVPGNEVLTLTADEAFAFALAERVVPDEAALLAGLHVQGDPTRLSDTALDTLIAIMTSTWMTTLLIAAGVFLAYAELHAPGHAVSGVGAILCFAALFGGRYIAGLAGPIEMIVFVLGAVLILVEIFVIPGFAVSGVVGILCCLAALVAVMIPHAPGEVPIPRSPLDWQVLQRGLAGLGLGVVGAIVLAAMLMRYFEKVPLANKLLLPEAAGASGVPVPEGSPVLRIREGDRGVVAGMCRPVGVVRFGNDLFDAMTEGEPLDPGTNVRVIRCEGNRLVVEKV
ncbi:MAG: hypothetical protein NTV86_13655 [Planctomycetota bacterium]|nr:hypothetical protein [Planctomycetota bacterium]